MMPQRIRWYKVEGYKDGKPQSLYDGPDEKQARAAMEASRRSPQYGGTVHMEFRWRYPPPERCTACQCRNAPARQVLCPFGHCTECHYPQECVEAECRHLVEFGQAVDHQSLLTTTESDRMAAWLAQGVHPDDKAFADSPDAGTPACVCSRCGALIEANPVRLWDGDKKVERRYHQKCIGIPEVDCGEEKSGR